MSFGGGSHSITGYLTGGLIDPVAPDYAGAATKAEKQRQGLINTGLADINAVFSGGTTPVYNLTQQGSTYDPSKQYYVLNSKGQYAPWNPKPTHSSLSHELGLTGLLTGGGPMGVIGSMFGGLFGGANPIDWKKRYGEMTGKNMLFTSGGNKTYAGFGPDFFNQAAKNYVNYEVPQLAKQYNDTSRSIQYGLANRGLTGSSAAGRAKSDLAYTTGLQEQGIVDSAKGVANNLKNQIEQARQNAINMLYQSADPAQGLQRAVSSAAGFSIPQTFTPIANAFSGLANQYASNYLYNPPGQAGQFYNQNNPYSQFYGNNLGSSFSPLPSNQ